MIGSLGDDSYVLTHFYFDWKIPRTFVGGRFSKAHELKANKHVGFFALLSSGHGPLLGYTQTREGPQTFYSESPRKWQRK